MTLSRNLIVSLLVGLLTLSTCKKNTNKQEPLPPDDPTYETITGKIVLPTSVSINNLSVQSPVGESAVINEGYKIKTFAGVSNTTFVVNSNGNTILMGYNLTGSSGHDISTSSTALALLMNTPIMLSLSPQGKKDIVPVLRSDPQFPKLVADVAQVISSGKDLFDVNNTVLLSDIQKIITSVTTITGKKSSISPASLKSTMVSVAPSDKRPPMLIVQSGRELNFYGDGVMYAAVAGIYKDDKKLESIELEGEKFFPSSLLDVINGSGTLLGGASTHGWPFVLQGDGTFKIKIRTGLPGSNDGSEEFKRAQYLNAKNLTIYMLESFIPFIDKQKASCIENIVLAARNQINNAASVENTWALFYVVVNTLSDDVDNISSCLGVKDISEKKFFKTLGTFFKWADRGSALLGGSINIGYYARQWAITNPSLDVCYTAKGNEVSACKDVVEPPVDEPPVTVCPYGTSGAARFNMPQKYLFAESGELIFTGGFFVSPVFDCKGKKQISVTYYTSAELEGSRSKIVVNVPCDCNR